MESFNSQKFEKQTGVNASFIQDNESMSTKGVLRGIHFQGPPHAQAKLVRVIKGEVLDIIVDLRSNSPTFGQHLSISLSDLNKKQVYIPTGFGHGFITLSDEAIFAYKVSHYYSKESDCGIRWDDPTLAIDWKLDNSMIRCSEKDSNLPSFRDYSLDPIF